MQLAARIANAVDQCLLDDHVDVFKAFVEDKGAGFDVAGDPLQPFNNRIALGSGNQPDRLQHGRMGD